MSVLQQHTLTPTTSASGDLTSRSANRPRLALIVKHFPPGARLSGVSTFVNLLADQLAKQLDVYILSCCDNDVADRWNSERTSQLIAVRQNFWLNAPSALGAVRADAGLIVSGIHRSALIAPVFYQFMHRATKHTRLGFLQAVNLDHAPGPLARRTLSRFHPRICSSRLLTSMLPGEFQYVPPAISLDKISSTIAEIKGRRVRVGYFNHFNTTKGIDLALNAFRECAGSDVEFCVAGAGPLERRLRTDFDGRYGISFVGNLLSPIGYMKSCDVTVLPFRTSTSVLGLSQAALESLACGVPVVGTNFAAITEAVRHEKEGLICDSAADLPSQISRLVTDHCLRGVLARNARQRAQEFDVSAIASRFINLLFPN